MSAGNLSREEAEARAGRVSRVAYVLRLRLGLDGERYSGHTRIDFELAAGEDPVWLDFTGGELQELTVDGRPADHAMWSDHRIALAELGPGEHRVEVAYTNPYDTGGVGLHRFVDPEDEGVTIYTDFEPFNAHRLFPCFDQPDLKATYEVEVDAPAGWVVISSGPETETHLVGDGVRHRFVRTPPFSTYLLAVIAGELVEWQGQAGSVPLRLFARRSLAKHVEADELLALTARGIAFFAQAFAQPYPFSKYDQIFVPEFNSGAMENVGAVTLSEHMIFRGQTSRGDRLGRAETLLHELAHMWFGNLVTMRWWDGLWLNESFATFASYLALEADPDCEGVWESFRAKVKDWAFRQDELATSHPVACPVPDTATTLLNFDGITYGKGAAALKQLSAYLGEEDFLRGIKLYFARFAWGNTDLDDFLEALTDVSGQDLRPWAEAWLLSAGVPELELALEPEGGRIRAFSISQRAAAGGALCPHRLRVSLWSGSPPRPEHEVEVLLDGEHVRVPELVGRPLPRLVVLDRGDRTYAKVALDPLSLGFAREALEELEDPLVKVQLWSSLWQMVRDQRLSALEFLELAERRLAGERRAEIVDAVLEHARVALVLYLGDAQRDAMQDRLVEAAWAGLERGGDPELRLVWLRQLVGTARAPRDLARLIRLADGEEAIRGVALDQPLRWDLLARLSAHAYPGAVERLAAERERDPSDKGRKAALGVEAAAPDPEVKARSWETFVRPPAGWSDDALKASMSRFHWPHQRELLLPFAERFFADASAVHGRGNLELTQAFFRCLFPPYPLPAVLELAQRYLAESTEPGLRRLTREALSELERAAACRRLQEQLR